ncbi:MAG: hypothetical protein IK073_04880 [Paludibacteraceae bacterium]|nr:hypothetical protein [Paludibacteraceae bacterium]
MMEKQKIYKIVVTMATAVVTCVAIALGMESCTAVRTYTTTATYETRGDSVACIWTKTQEQYKGKKDNR